MIGSVIDGLKRQFEEKKVLVVGLGLQGGGVGLVKFLAGLGAKVKVTDLKTEDQLKDSLDQTKDFGVELTLGKHVLGDFVGADFIFKGPSVSWSLPLIIEAQKKGIPIDMELSFFAEHCPAKIIGVTGTRGKSTTTAMIFELLKQNHFPVYMAGSIPGVSTISLLNMVSNNDWVVLELPSWPLSGFHRKKISPHIAVFTNFYPDHLDYYRSLSDYLYDKKAIYLYQKPADFLIANISLRSIILKDNPKSQIIYFYASDFNHKLRHLKGEHNLENASACLKVAQVLGLNQSKAVEIITNFVGLPARQEIRCENKEVVFINDSASTIPTATVKAINTFSPNPIVLILGGNSKNLPFEEFISHLDKVEKIILLKGSFTDQILSQLKNKFSHKIIGPFDNLSEAVAVAYTEAKTISGAQGRKVNLLFSPAATSFSMFKNEFHRAEEYNKIVEKLLNHG